MEILYVKNGIGNSILRKYVNIPEKLILNNKKSMKSKVQPEIEPSGKDNMLLSRYKVSLRYITLLTCFFERLMKISYFQEVF